MISMEKERFKFLFLDEKLSLKLWWIERGGFYTDL